MRGWRGVFVHASGDSRRRHIGRRHFILEDRSGADLSFLTANVNKFVAAARKRPELTGIATSYLPDVPQEFVDVDRDKVTRQGVNIGDVYQTLQAFMGGYLVNYFNRFGRQWQVYVEAEGEFRDRARNIGQFYVANNSGQMVPLSAVTSVRASSGPEFTMRYNEYHAAQINCAAAPGYSSGQAMHALEEVFAADHARARWDSIIAACRFRSRRRRRAFPPRRSSGFRCCSCF